MAKEKLKRDMFDYIGDGKSLYDIVKHSYCPITVGGVYHDEIEELVINGKNLGVSLPKDIIPDESGNCRFDIYFGHDPNVFFGDYKGDQILITDKNTKETVYKPLSDYSLQKKSAEIQNGKIYINDVFTGIWCDVESWKPGTVWSLCYNEVLQKWITFYDWYPVESCNVDNIYFSFD